MLCYRGLSRFLSLSWLSHFLSLTLVFLVLVFCLFSYFSLW
jgi:hypothetical protein